jgi:xanthine dehydrogenase molybdopterin-binding subunit B
LEAASKVKVTYKEIQKPILTIKDAIQASSFWPIPFKDFIIGNAEDAISKAPFTASGEFFTESQYHFYMVCFSLR